MKQYNNNNNWRLWITTFCASIGNIVTGITIGWSSPSLAILQSDKSEFIVSNVEASWIASLHIIGLVPGSFLGMYLNTRVGPKVSTLFFYVVYTVAFTFILFAHRIEYLYVFRLLGGMGSGGSHSSIPVYISDITELTNRSLLLLISMVTNHFGCLLVYSIAPYVSLFTMACIAVILSIASLIFLLFLPNSPHYLMRIGKNEECKKALKWLRNIKNESMIEEEVKKCKTHVDNTKHGFFDGLKYLKEKENLRVGLIILLLHLAQQLTGNSVIGHYQQQIYTTLKVPINPEIMVILSCFVGLIFLLLSCIFVYRLNRKPVLIIGALGCATSMAVLGLFSILNDYHVVLSLPIKCVLVVFLLLFFASFSFSVFSVPLCITSELINRDILTTVYCILTVLISILSFVSVKTYYLIKDRYGIATVFFGFSIMTVLITIVMYYVVPETRAEYNSKNQDMYSKSELQKNNLPDISTTLEFNTF